MVVLIGHQFIKAIPRILYISIFITCIFIVKTILHDSNDIENEYFSFEIRNSSKKRGYLYHGLVKELTFYNARLDSKRLIKIYDWVWTAELWKELRISFSICLSTQGSMDRIHWMPELVQAWRGPVSLAVFIASPEEYIGLNLLVHHFRKCYPYFRNYVSIHIAIPSQVEDWTLDLDGLVLNRKETGKFLTTFPNFLCTESDIVLQQVLARFQANDKGKLFLQNYPQNHLRNIAKKACGTNWTFSTDIDIIPRRNSATLLQNFILTDVVKECSNCAYVIPTFELDYNQTYPESKEQLVNFWNKSLAKPFHIDVFKKAHNATNYQEWASTNLEEEPIKVSHVATNNTQYYEPFYISPSTIPEFQERFIGYGFTRSSQAQEAFTEGWTFQVLTPIFSIHWGLQNVSTLVNPGNERIIRRRQTYYNKRIFERFMKELELRKTLKIEEELERSLGGTTPDFSTN